jgi:hypothetical protein
MNKTTLGQLKRATLPKFYDVIAVKVWSDIFMIPGLMFFITI